MSSRKAFCIHTTVPFIWFAFIPFTFALNFPRKRIEREKDRIKSTAYIYIRKWLLRWYRSFVYIIFLKWLVLHCGHTNANQIYHTWLFSYSSSHLSSAFILVISPIYFVVCVCVYVLARVCVRISFISFRVFIFVFRTVFRYKWKFVQSFCISIDSFILACFLTNTTTKK